jgi:exosortase/archaeosortase family protein
MRGGSVLDVTRTAWIYPGVVLVALWPLWGWYLKRVSIPHEEEPLGWALALLTFGVLAYRDRRRGGRATSLLPAILLLAYAGSYPWFAPLPRAALGVGALGAVVVGTWLPGQPLLAAWGLLVLSLRVTPALQVYLGYPLRHGVTLVAWKILLALGVDVTHQGVVLLSGGQEVLVDVPCSGLRMLWAGLYLVLAMAWLVRLDSRRTLVALVLAIPLLVLGNVFRVVVLFLAETGRLSLPGGGHAGVGVLAFLLTASGLLALCQKLGGPPPRESHLPLGRTSRVQGLALLGAAFLAGGVPLVYSPAPPDLGTFPGWPRKLLGRGLEPVALLPGEADLVRKLPGRIACFSDGTRRIHMAWLVSPTSRLHARAACSAAWGYQVRSLPDWRDAQGNSWGSLLATRGEDSLVLRERIEDAAGGSFTSVYSWYAATLLGTSPGPWWYFSTQEAAFPVGE